VIESAPVVGPEQSGSSTDADTDGAATEGETELGETDDSVESDSATSSKKAVKPKVSVEFVANDFYFVYVKVGGRILTLEPKAKIRLPVGKHTVYLQQKKSDSWKKAGSIRLSKGSSYRVEMKKPASLRLIKK